MRKYFGKVTALESFALRVTALRDINPRLAFELLCCLELEVARVRKRLVRRLGASG